MRLPAPCLSLVLAAAALPACASAFQDGKAPPAGGEDFARRGPYAGISLIQGFEEFDGIPAGDSDVGIGIRGGVRLQPEVAVEGFLESVPGFNVGRGPFREELDLLSLGAQGKYFFTTDKIQPYALAGLGIARAEVDRSGLDDSGTFLRIGFGSDFHLDRDFSLFAELAYNRMFGGVEDLDHADFQVGVEFHF